MDRTVFSITVSETDDDREFWATRSWIGNSAGSVRSGSVVVVPWLNFREQAEAVFPQGTTDFVTELRETLTVAIAVDSGSYAEIALYSKQWRLPTLLVTAVMLPTLTGALGNIISNQLGQTQPDDTIEMRVIVERLGGPCISVEYKGPPGRALDAVTSEIAKCLPGTPVDHSSTGHGHHAKRPHG